MKTRIVIVVSFLCIVLASCSTSRITYESGVQDKNVSGILLDGNVIYIHLMQIDGNNVNPFMAVRDLILFKPGKRLINFVYSDGDNLARSINITHDFAENTLYGVTYKIVEEGSPELDSPEYVKIITSPTAKGIGGVIELLTNKAYYIKVSLYVRNDISLTNAIMKYSQKEPAMKESGATKQEETGK